MKYFTTHARWGVTAGSDETRYCSRHEDSTAYIRNEPGSDRAAVLPAADTEFVNSLWERRGFPGG